MDALWSRNSAPFSSFDAKSMESYDEMSPIVFSNKSCPIAHSVSMFSDVCE